MRRFSPAAATAAAAAVSLIFGPLTDFLPVLSYR